VSPSWPKQELANVHYTAANVASNEVGVHRFKIRGRKYALRQNALAKSGSKPLDLIFQSAYHVYS
jgi:hypothetical protein